MKKRKVILTMQMTLDGFVAGTNDEMNWVDTEDGEIWDEMFNDLKSVDTYLLGRKMYPGYSSYWQSMLSNATAPADHVKFAKLADKTQHIVFTKTDFKPDWKNTRVAKDPAEEIARLKKEEGKDIMVWGGANFASNLVKLGLIDEFRISLNPALVGEGKSFTNGLKQLKKLKFLRSKTLKSGLVILWYQS